MHSPSQSEPVAERKEQIPEDSEQEKPGIQDPGGRGTNNATVGLGAVHLLLSRPITASELSATQ